MTIRRLAPIERLLLRSEIAPSGCWIWSGALNEHGYGVIGLKDGTTTLCHRLAFRTWRGPIPTGLYVCHDCDTPACWNPDHLFLGTQADNMADAARKGRMAGNGTRTPAAVVANRLANTVAPERPDPRAKLTDDEVRAIRADGRPQARIARDYGVSQALVSLIRSGRRYAHVR